MRAEGEKPMIHHRGSRRMGRESRSLGTIMAGTLLASLLATTVWAAKGINGDGGSEDPSRFSISLTPDAVRQGPAKPSGRSPAPELFHRESVIHESAMVRYLDFDQEQYDEFFESYSHLAEDVALANIHLNFPELILKNLKHLLNR